ncbi:MAG: DUF302 domain-containing protein [Bacteroidetes bacterium]|nr:DUF302 domain-containing protein [Bacteroidota bacterium]MBS1739562.1 DUF302 domain-containing protein [Bacteroidota bacterium]MBS1776540.1 DUF302 domain-containing protein [Bacteroidota bacterium]
MSYHFSKTVKGTWDQTREQLATQMKAEGFGVLTEIDMQKALKDKLGVEFRRYSIFGFCNPNFAHQALQAEPYIGTMLPCNIVMQQHEDGQIEVSAIDPVASMQAIENPKLATLASEVRAKLERGILAL